MEYYFFTWGPFAVTGFTFSIAVSLLASLYLCYIEGLRKGLSADRILLFFVLALIGGFGGARCVYVLFVNKEYYRLNPGEVWSLQDGGLTFYGGLLGAMILLGIWSFFANFSLKSYLDAAAPALALGLAVSRIGYPPAGQAASASLPWVMQVEGSFIHPDQAYMMVLLCCLFLLLWYRRLNLVYHGELFVWFLGAYGIFEFFVEFFRVSPRLFWFITYSQAASFVLICLAVTYLIYGEKKIAAPFYQFDAVLLNRGKIFIWQAAFVFLLMIASLFLHFYFNSVPAG